MRMHNKLFITDIACTNDPTQLMHDYIELFSIPILIDNNGEVYGTNGLQNMPVPTIGIKRFFEHPKSGCGLIDYCKNCKLDPFDEGICSKEPWLQCKKEVSCPLAIYFKGFGVENKQFVLKHF